MKLSKIQVRRIQMATGLTPITEGDPFHQALTRQFGEETFYIAKRGLLVFEPADDMREACEDPVRAWRLAEFSEKNGESVLDTIERERTTMVIDLANPAGDQRSIN